MQETAYFDSHTRTRIVKLHIFLNFLYKGIAIGLSYLLVPLMIDYLGVEKYGIWITLFSILSWITFFDIGLGNGLRNKLAEALAINDRRLAKIYVSTAYVVIGIIAFVFFVLLLFILPFIDWTRIFNTSLVSNTEFSILILIVSFLFLLNFVLSLCNQLFYAYQKASLVALGQVLLNFLAVGSVYILIKYTSSNLIYLGSCYGLSMVLSNVLLTSYFFRKYPTVIPSKKYIDISKVKELASLGIKFFIIQMAVLVIFTTDNIIITQVLGPKEVTPYSVVRKLFSIITMGHSILLTPLWSAYTEAYAKGDILWIKGVLKKLNLLMIPITIIVLIFIIFARDIINIWVGSYIHFSFMLVILMGVYTIISVWNNVYAYFVNGIGAIKPQLYSAIIGGVINIPLSIYFAKFLKMGISGVILGTIISLSLFAFIGPIQTYYILNKNLIK